MNQGEKSSGKSFSERMGLKKARTEIQIESMDEALRNQLWNVLEFHYWRRGKGTYKDEITSEMMSFFNKLWHHHFKLPVDSLTFSWSKDYGAVRMHFFNCQWNEVYDFIEFTVNNYPESDIKEKFKKTCNEVLEEELSAYRFVGDVIAPITSESEISEIDEAIEQPLKAVSIHLKNALGHMSNRESPDHRNSIKESISAVEAICKLITKDENATLGQALKIVETKVGLHPALKNAFSSLYGYTSSTEGIRHSLMGEPTVSFDDSKFMLVICSAFINYLVFKAQKAGVEL